MRAMPTYGTLLAAGVAVTVVWSSAARSEGRKDVTSTDTLPRYSYPIEGSVADVLTASPASFQALARPIEADIDKILAEYDIKDQATLRTILQARLGGQIASGQQDQAALATIADIRSHQDKAEARLVGNLVHQSFLEARLISKDKPGVCPADFSRIYAGHLAALPWKIVGVGQKRQKGFAQVATASFFIGMAAGALQPMLDTTHTLSNAAAWQLLAARANMDVVVVCRPQIAAALTAYVQRNDTQKPDIWAARSVTLAASARLTPVNVAIWDSGFDSTLFAGQLLLSPDGAKVSGPAYDVLYQATQGELAPMTPAQMAAYPAIVAEEHGISDLQNGIDSPAAAAVRDRITKMSPAQAQGLFQSHEMFAAYMHGTHVAGIAAAGNPAVRLSSTRVTWDTKPVPTPPTEDLQSRLAASYGTTVAWFRTHNIRLVNMSWWDRPSNYEDQLEKNGIGKSADERKQLARHYFDIERNALYAAIRSAPEILFVTIAGNNNSDNAFEETIPSSFRLPNLIVVGAVDQAGRPDLVHQHRAEYRRVCRRLPGGEFRNPEVRKSG